MFANVRTNLLGKILYYSTACNSDNFIQYLGIQRDTPEEDLKSRDYQQFKDIGAACLSGGDREQLLKFVQDEKNQVTSLVP